MTTERPAKRVVGHLHLVLPGAFDATGDQPPHEERVGPLWPVGMPAGPGCDGLHVRDGAGSASVEGQAAKQRAAVHTCESMVPGGFRVPRTPRRDSAGRSFT